MIVKWSKYNVFSSVHNEDFKFIYNGLKGAVIGVPKDEFDLFLRPILNNRGTFDCSHFSSFEALIQAGVLVPELVDEIEILRIRYNDNIEDKKALGLTIVTSLGCNFDCPYCYESKRKSLLSERTEKYIYEYICKLADGLEKLSVHWFGGEPLVNLNSIERLSMEFMELCAVRGIKYSADITTNGSLLTGEIAAKLKKLNIKEAQICLDGPPMIHDKMRPLRGGGGTFMTILENIINAVNYIDITVRVNCDKENYSQAPLLLDILENAGLKEKITIYLGHLVKVDDKAPEPSPSSAYQNDCYTNPEFAEIELQFNKLALARGFNKPSIIRPISTPCTAVRPREYVIGSGGELYKCWKSIGNQNEVIGNVGNMGKLDSRTEKWLSFNPFDIDECVNCLALPVCMGGCPHNAFDINLYEERCSTFKYNYKDQVDTFISSKVK